MTFTLAGYLIGIGCVAALGVAAYAEDRLEALALALAAAVAFLVYNGAWERIGPAYWWADLLRIAGLPDSLKMYTATERGLREALTMGLIAWFIWCNPLRLWLWLMFMVSGWALALEMFDWLAIDAGIEQKVWRSLWSIFSAIMVVKLSIIITLGAGGFRDAWYLYWRRRADGARPARPVFAQEAIAKSKDRG